MGSVLLFEFLFHSSSFNVSQIFQCTSWENGGEDVFRLLKAQHTQLVPVGGQSSEALISALLFQHGVAQQLYVRLYGK